MTGATPSTSAPAAATAPTAAPAALDWRDAYNETDTVLIAMEGLIHAAETLASEHSGLCNPEPASAALTVVLRCLREKNDALREARSAEFRAGLDLDKRKGQG